MKKAILRNFDSRSYTATIEIAGSPKTYLERVSAARNLPVAEISAGRKLAVVFLDECNVKDAVVVVL